MPRPRIGELPMTPAQRQRQRRARLRREPPRPPAPPARRPCHDRNAGRRR